MVVIKHPTSLYIDNYEVLDENHSIYKCFESFYDELGLKLKSETQLYMVSNCNFSHIHATQMDSHKTTLLNMSLETTLR